MAADTMRLRSAILRPGMPLSACEYHGDSTALHLGAFIDGRLLGVATAHREEKADFSYPLQFRLRGMAVDKAAQGQGIGKALVLALLQNLNEENVPFLWCNAREVAIPFYESLGFSILGNFFDIPGIGPHKVMYRETK